MDRIDASQIHIRNPEMERTNYTSNTQKKLANICCRTYREHISIQEGGKKDKLRTQSWSLIKEAMTKTSFQKAKNW